MATNLKILEPCICSTLIFRRIFKFQLPQKVQICERNHQLGDDIVGIRI
ncbi:hypothetical protein OROMI_000711 [Orobanche minor]